MVQWFGCCRPKLRLGMEDDAFYQDWARELNDVEEKRRLEFYEKWAQEATQQHLQETLLKGDQDVPDDELRWLMARSLEPSAASPAASAEAVRGAGEGRAGGAQVQEQGSAAPSSASAEAVHGAQEGAGSAQQEAGAGEAYEEVKEEVFFDREWFKAESQRTGISRRQLEQLWNFEKRPRTQKVKGCTPKSGAR